MCKKTNQTLMLLLTIVAVVWSFQQDTTIQVGELQLGVTKTAVEESGLKQRWFTDSLGRVVQYHSNGGGSKGAISHTKGLYLTRENRVKYACNDSSSSGPGYVKHTKDTLWGEEWNNKGMVVKGHFFQWYRDGGLFTTTEYDLQLLYDSTGVNCIEKMIDSSTIKIFKVDRYYKAGALMLPVMTIHPDSLPEGAECLIDSLGRTLYKKYSKGGPKGGWSVEEQLELNVDSLVTLSIYENNHTSVGQSYNRLDSLTGLSWNDKGMITTGIMHRIIDENGQITDTTFTVIITYDESGLIPVSTTEIKETDLVSPVIKNREYPVVQCGPNMITLRGIRTESNIVIFDVKGRVFKRTSLKGGETMSISTQDLSRGVYLLQIDNRNITFIK